jgi:hypothetical protein
MARRTFSGLEVVKVLVNAGGFEWRRTTGDHANCTTNTRRTRTTAGR